MSETGIPTPPTRHKEFYFEDGNICLQAENTIFRLLKSQLAAQSTMFDDMFAIGGEQQGIAEGEVYDGVPLVHVEESVENWTKVCQILWNPPSAHERPKDFDTIASVLRISTKYSMDMLRECILKWFEEATLHSAHTSGPNPLPVLENYDSKPGLTAKVIPVAQECDVQSVLPLALYHVAVTSSSTLSRPIGVADDDLGRALLGLARLQNKWWKFLRGNERLGLDENVGRCGFKVGSGPSKLPCGEFKSPRIQMLEEGTRDPLRYLSRQSRSQSLCPWCRDEHHGVMVEIYNSLETVFDLK